jgi:putative ABC transport system substrate-binding protein
MRRREFITLVGGVALPRIARAQLGGKIPRVGYLWHAGSADEEGPLFTAAVEGFAKLGYVDGVNIRLEHRFPNEVPERFRSMAAELVSLRVDCLVCAGIVGALALKEATTTIPIVFMFLPDPVGSKLVENLARPGGNVTGLTNFAPDLIGKRLQFLKETIPGLTRIALLVDPTSQVSRLYIDVSEGEAAALGMEVQTYEARSRNELEPALDAIARAGIRAMTINPDGLVYQGKEIIAKLAMARGMALCAYSRETFRAGALMAYGPDNIAACHRAAVYVDKILKGAKPSELPVEAPTNFEFFINLKIAKMLGLEVPLRLQQFASEVIE